MNRFQNQNQLRHILYSWPIIAILAVITLLLGRAALYAYLDLRTTNRTYLEVKKERGELVLEKTRLEDRLGFLSSEYGLEKELRRKFGLLKPEEGLLVVVDRPQILSGTEGGEGGSFWSLLADFFASLFKSGNNG